MIQADQAMLAYIDILKNDSKFKAKVAYSLCCLQSSIQPSNANREANLQFLASHTELLIKVGKIYADADVLGNLVSIFNELQQFGVSNDQFVTSVLASQPMKGQITDSLVKQICNLLYHSHQNIQLVLKMVFDLMNQCSDRLTSEQSQWFVNIINRNVRFLSGDQCLELTSLPRLKESRVLHILWEKVLQSSLNSKKVEQVVERMIRSRPNNDEIAYISLGICLWGQTGSIKISYLDQWYKNQRKPFFLTFPSFEITQASILANKLEVFQYLAKELMLNGQQTSSNLQIKKASLQKLSEQDKDILLIIPAIINRKAISPNLQNQYCRFIPVQFITNCQVLLQQLRSSPSLNFTYRILQRAETIMTDATPYKIVTEFCLLALQISLCHLEQEHFLTTSISLIKNWVRTKYVLEALGNKKRQSAFFNKAESKDQESENYILLLPMVIEEEVRVKPNASEQVLRLPLFNEKLNAFMTSEKVKIEHKFYIADWLIRAMNKHGVNQFLHCLFRTIDQQSKVFDLIEYYLKNKVGAWGQKCQAWLLDNFYDDLERLLEKVLAKLANGRLESPRKIIFSLQKYNIFNAWSSIYRWSLNPLDEIQNISQSALVDCFQVFETLIENCKELPLEVIKKFFQIVIKHWESYNHEHMFTIERIFGYLISDKDINLTEISEYARREVDSKVWSVDSPIFSTSLSVILGYAFMEEIVELQEALEKQIFEAILMNNSAKSNEDAQIFIFAQELLMWKFQYDDTVIKKEVAQAISNILKRKEQYMEQYSSKWPVLMQNCLQIMATLPHSCNLLLLPLKSILSSFLMSSTKIINFSIDIINNIVNAKVKAISKFQLEDIITQTELALIVSHNSSFIDPYVNLLRVLCLTEGSPYEKKPLKGQENSLILEMIRSQIVLDSIPYRPEVVIFALESLGAATMPQNWAEFIAHKYEAHAEITETINKGYKIKPKVQRSEKPIDAQKVQKESDKKPSQDFIQKRSVVETPSSPQQPQQKLQNKQNSEKKSNFQGKEERKEERKEEKHQQVQQNVQQKVISQSSTQKVNVAKDENISGKKQQKQQAQQVKQVEKKGKIESAKIKSQNIEKQGKQLKLKISIESPTKRRRLKEGEMENMSTIKEHLSYLSNLAGLELDEATQQNASSSLEYLKETVVAHQYYCHKIVGLGIVSKCMALHEKTLFALRSSILSLFKQISIKRDKNLVIFADKSSINFFKMVLKHSISQQKENPENSVIVEIVRRCWNSVNEFIEQELIGMLMEMCKIGLNRNQILQLIIVSSDSNITLLNDIYERNLLNSMKAFLSQPAANLNQQVSLSLWVRLAGVICVNSAIRQKLFNLKIHELAYNHLQTFKKNNCLSDLAFFYANLCLDFEKCSQWCIEKQIPKLFMQEMSQSPQTPVEFYKFFKSFGKNNPANVEYLLRINFHSFMCAQVQQKSENLSQDYAQNFYQCLGQLFTKRSYQYFLKQQIFFHLLRNFQSQRSAYIYECCYNFVLQLQQKEEACLLLKQGLTSTDSVFNSKVKDDASYPYALKIYIQLLRKFGRFDKNFIDVDLTHKIIRKGIYSINFNGKRTTMEFLVTLSHVDKVCHGNANCIRIFEPIFNIEINLAELKLFKQFLQVEALYKKPIRETEELTQKQEERYPMRFKSIVSIDENPLLGLVLNKLEEQSKNLSSQQISQIIEQVTEILIYFTANQTHSITIYNRINMILLSLQAEIFKFEQSLPLINALMNWKSVQKLFSYNEVNLKKYLSVVGANLKQFLADPKKVPLIKQYICILGCCSKNAIINANSLEEIVSSYLMDPQILEHIEDVKKFVNGYKKMEAQIEINEQIKKIMTDGVKVKMYKTDGSTSTLTLFFTKDLLEINCAQLIGDPVKSKWRMACNQINCIIFYETQEQFAHSVFEKSSGLFSKAPPMSHCLAILSASKNFFISFDSAEQMKTWSKYFRAAQQSSKHLLTAVIK